MASRSTLTEQLAVLGVQLPGWPKEPEGEEATGDWIQRGQAYAEGVRLWRAQLRNAPESTKGVFSKLVHHLSETRQLGKWDLWVATAVIAGTGEQTDDEEWIFRTSAHGACQMTTAQLLAASLIEVSEENWLPAAEAIQYLIEFKIEDSKQIPILISILIEEGHGSRRPMPNKKTEFNDWMAEVHHQITLTSALSGSINLEEANNDSSNLASTRKKILERISPLESHSNISDTARKQSLRSLSLRAEVARQQINAGSKVKGFKAAAETLEMLSDQEGMPKVRAQAKKQILNAMLETFRSNKLSDEVLTYAELNSYRQPDEPLPAAAHEAFEAMARLSPATPLILIENIHQARELLNSTPYWIAYGNVRTGSTMVFNLLRILANSLTDHAISAWEGDFASPEKFFEMIEDSQSVKHGVLKIHRNHEAVNQRLRCGQAKAILTHRNMRDCCYSYWRMLNNPASPFFRENPPLDLLEKFLKNEIRCFQAKAMQAQTLLIREEDIRSNTAAVIGKINAFLGLSIHAESSQFLANYLSTNRLAELSNASSNIKNSTGHNCVTFFHPDHISTQGSINSCSDEVKEVIEKLLQAAVRQSLDKSAYILPESVQSEG